MVVGVLNSQDAQEESSNNAAATILEVGGNYLRSENTFNAQGFFANLNALGERETASIFTLGAALSLLATSAQALLSKGAPSVLCPTPLPYWEPLDTVEELAPVQSPG
jgi:hypothetical protein